MEELIINNLNDRDKVIRTLADVKLTCHLRLKSGTCKGYECDDCFKYQTYNSCLEQMSDFDKLQIDNIYESEYSKLNIRQPYIPKSESAKPKSKLIAKFKGFGKVLIIFFLMFFCIFGLAYFLVSDDPGFFELLVRFVFIPVAVINLLIVIIIYATYD